VGDRTKDRVIVALCFVGVSSSLVLPPRGCVCWRRDWRRCRGSATRRTWPTLCVGGREFIGRNTQIHHPQNHVWSCSVLLYWPRLSFWMRAYATMGRGCTAGLQREGLKQLMCCSSAIEVAFKQAFVANTVNQTILTPLCCLLCVCGCVCVLCDSALASRRPCVER
jgi:hypothetical protein